ncbi:sensor domain-containing diguanylate cyclase [Pseudomonas sp. RP23018S]|uniref:sensor domain-containing diguanylate cyclase n=1 Tax=Pseudomonas sp. RP23018S TaxID=3096037 RepID=UPI002ACACC11|nr:sensor domain-containing diguanylate cyclase [Pseudomonas sp. RP23018S]MDZ5602989.1 sensor domain-containing diguanylate cyclase [Pseudomonas sp. RP23018S]
MTKNSDSPPFDTSSPDTAHTLLALLHAQAEVARLSERDQLFSSLLESVNAALWAFDWETRRVLYVSPAYERIFGRSPALVMADFSEWRDAVYPDDLAYAERSLGEVLLTGAVEDREYRIINAAGEVRWLSDKCFLKQPSEGEQRVIIVGIAEDITEKKQLESELHRLATIDVLTQSSNRRHFFECAHQAFEEACAENTPLSFLLLDIDDFKQINDSYGHQEGDQVLQRIADSGKNALRRGDLFGRIGGEEFAAVFPGCTAEVAEQIAERLQREIQRLSFNHGQKMYRVTVSQGLTGRIDSDQGLDTLFARADEAMYQAKRQGKNQIVQG